ncbi:MAG: thiamine diphosphokinase [Paracoccus sp. (in: a-proteobacteria)]|jgi:thiamine pyrophosphokinase|uniref:thiamine diphosphokinase n=1 Tax=unclassified Paracoccus (in: a-proteobacteria) TaxID=2688777 RepID=UPI000C395516|nr:MULTISPECIES: thiamine diphosphokinase [unclassified Paracoccus (in: a-proteobacteria)]MAN57810.1 thiamine diphosphokinase [Paracoccus sp. (in: a-proteobacteria)]MBA50029.1 thiamine diphosphokinase [Paracoccus sp. (in: a-proteobacteria)]MCS5601247.1 thiamine diphosphokinase [Paracoccus sp. (in: a-proteobacteria)]|tara:strand:+ start:2178 stop:2843 length:666 start_codon:yes stop_codon:yes gene_type:complete
MIAPVVIADRGVTVIGGGAVAKPDLLTALAIAPTLVAADGGADRALALGRRPDWVIGDLDSISSGAESMVPADRVVRVAEQDSTDFGKCLGRIAAPFVLAVGFTGLRVDHTLAALSLMARAPRPPVVMLSRDDVIFRAPSRTTLPLMPGTRVSLFPMGPARGVSTGLEWPIEGIEFDPAGRVGTSNMATGLVTLRIEGRMLVMLPRNALATVLTALRLPTG